MCMCIHAPTHDTYMSGHSFILCAFTNQKGKVGMKGGKVGKNGKPVKEADSDNDDFEEVRESQ